MELVSQMMPYGCQHVAFPFSLPEFRRAVSSMCDACLRTEEKPVSPTSLNTVIKIRILTAVH
jgi:hypothetical protein